MKRTILLALILPALSGCGSLLSGTSTSLVVKLHLNPPAPPFRIQDDTTIAFMQANGVLQIKLSLTRADSGQAVSSRVFNVQEGSGLFENVPVGNLNLRAEGLDLNSNALFIDTVTATIQAGRENTVSVGLDPIPTIDTCTKDQTNSNHLNVIGKRFTNASTPLVDGSAVNPILRSGNLIRLDITQLAAGSHQVVVLNKPEKPETQSGPCAFTM